MHNRMGMSVCYFSSVFYETYGCQMNVSDMEVVRSILQSSDFVETGSAKDVGYIIMNVAVRNRTYYPLHFLRNCYFKTIPACYMYMGAQQFQTLVVLVLHCSWPRAGVLVSTQPNSTYYPTGKAFLNYSFVFYIYISPLLWTCSHATANS